MRKTIAAAAATSIAALTTAPAAAHATPSPAPCVASVDDHLAAAAHGYGTPAEWADLSFWRSAGIQCTRPGQYEVLLTDNGELRTKPGAGTPNGAGGRITHRVDGAVAGVYALDVTGRLAVPAQRALMIDPTEYVRQLFAPGAVVTGHQRVWDYTTLCGERWRNDFQHGQGRGEEAGNITGLRCTTPIGASEPPSIPPAPQASSSPGGAHSTAVTAAGAAVLLLIGLGIGAALGSRRRTS